MTFINTLDVMECLPLTSLPYIVNINVGDISKYLVNLQIFHLWGFKNILGESHVLDNEDLDILEIGICVLDSKWNSNIFGGLWGDWVIIGYRWDLSSNDLLKIPSHLSVNGTNTSGMHNIQ